MTANSLPIEVHHNRFMVGFMLLISCLSLILAILFADALQTIMGALLLVFSVLMWRQPLLVVTNTEIQLRNSLGMTLRRLPYARQEVHMEGNTIWVKQQRLPIIAWITHKPDMIRLKAYFANLSQA